MFGRAEDRDLVVLWGENPTVQVRGLDPVPVELHRQVAESGGGAGRGDGEGGRERGEGAAGEPRQAGPVLRQPGQQRPRHGSVQQPEPGQQGGGSPPGHTVGF